MFPRKRKLTGIAGVMTLLCVAVASAAQQPSTAASSLDPQVTAALSEISSAQIQRNIETLAGFLLAHLGHIPSIGESIEYGGRRYTVAEMAGRRISRVNVTTIAPPSDRTTPETANRELSS